MNLYVHFPFCRRKCTYCALHSFAGATAERRSRYVARLGEGLARMERQGLFGGRTLSTLYFGGGSPALCDLKPFLAALAPHLTADTEFTVELHPNDVSPDLLMVLRDGGVNRISMGVQSLDDATLREMNRGYSLAEARHAFARVKSVFPNAGIDLIVGYPGDTPLQTLPLKDWDLAHCSVYSLILEEKSLLSRQLKKHPALAAILPDDPTVLDAIRRYARSLREIGLERYEISNYARADTPCRHNLAVWRGEDYYGLGEGACGRIGRWRTRHWWGQPLSVKNGDTPRAAPPPTEGHAPEIETVDGDFDEKERTLFRLRTKEGLDTTGHADWLPILARAAANGLVKKDGPVYRLTERGTEVCDALLAELI